MTRTRWVLAGTFLALIAVVLAPRTSRNGPFLPKSPDEVVETVPAGGEARKARAAARAAVASNPEDEGAAVQLAQGYLDAARAQGNDVRLIGRAQAALAHWWDLPAPPAKVRLLRATIRQSLHDFTGARADLDALVAADPNDVQAWLTRATVAQVVGDYAAAEQSCAALEGKVRPVISTVCRAPLLGLQGKARQGAEAIEAVVAHDRGKLLAWATSVDGEIRWWAGDTAMAETLLAGAVQMDPADDYTRGALADLLLDANRLPEVVTLLKGHESNDALLLRLCLAKQDDACATLAERVAATRQRGDTVHRREESRYALHVEEDVDAALALAIANFQVQKEPADVRVLLEAAKAAKKPEAAAPALAWMKQTGFEWPPVRKLAEELSK